MAFQRHVTTPISAHCVIAVNSLTVVTSLNLLCQQHRKKGLKLFLAGVKASFRLLIGLSSHPGANMLHMAYNLFWCYRPPAASGSTATHS